MDRSPPAVRTCPSIQSPRPRACSIPAQAIGLGLIAAMNRGLKARSIWVGGSDVERAAEWTGPSALGNLPVPVHGALPHADMASGLWPLNSSSPNAANPVARVSPENEVFRPPRTLPAGWRREFGSHTSPRLRRTSGQRRPSIRKR